MTTQDPVNLLLYEPAHRRVAARLRDMPRDIQPILFGGTSSPADADALAARAGDVEVAWASPDMYVDGKLAPFMRIVHAAPTLRWFQSGSAGFDNPLLRAVIDKGIPFTTNSGPANSIAEYVFATVLDHFADGPKRRQVQAERRWSSTWSREINGSTWLLVGVGRIGRRVATRALAFEAQVIAVSRGGTCDLPGVEAHPATALHALLPRADVVVVAVPLAADTTHLIDAEFLRHMKAGSVLVNVARGPVVDDAALLAALDTGMPERAILDVFTQEPLPPESPFWTHPRVTVTSHVGGMGSGLVERSDRLFLDNLRRYLARQPLEDLVRP